MTKPDAASSTANQQYILACGLLLAAALAMVPQRIVEPVRRAWYDALKPGLTGCTSIQAWTADRLGFLAHWRQTAQAAHEQAAELEKLRRERDELAAQTAALSAKLQTIEHSTPKLPPLVAEDLVPARPLGMQSRAMLQRQGILEAGAEQRVAPGDYVLETALQTMDAGSSAGLQPGMLVLAGSRVRGKLLDVGEQTSTWLPVRSANYRDLVQIATMHEGRLRFGPRGVLEGTGGRLCRIKLIETTTPVAQGDYVFTVAEESPAGQPLWYGNIVRVEQLPGQSHWEIWMEPAADEGFTPLVVLRRTINPDRIGQLLGN